MAGVKIIGGDLKRRKVGTLPRGVLLRPILARIKKSLFDILKNHIAHAYFLDLFAGSGAVGLEALSRGAKKVVFVDSNPVCQKWIQKTLEKIYQGTTLRVATRRGEYCSGHHGQARGILRCENPSLSLMHGRAEIHCRNVLSGLGWLNEKFDLVFSGAPYVNAEKRPLYFVQDLLEIIRRDGVLKDDGWFIAQHHKKETFQMPNDWNFFRQERYGDSVLSFFCYVGIR